MIDDRWMPPRLPGTWQQVLRRRVPLARAIAAWLPGRRWFGGKAGVIVGVTVADVHVLPATDADVAMLIVGVSFEDGERHTYNVPVTRMPFGFVASGAVIATLDDGLLYDAMLTDHGCRAVVTAALSDTTGHPRRRRLSRFAGSLMRPVLVEQSNSSVLVGRSLIAKLVRRLEPGRNPDAELPELLRANGFTHVPGVAATFDVELAGGTAEAVIVHDLIRNHGDLWAWMLAALADHRPADTTRIARLLGQRTAEMHRALNTGELADMAWQRALVRHLAGELRTTAAARRQLSGLSNGAVDLTRFDRLCNTWIAAPLMRVHGDLHLGQVLATTDHDVAIIDFEGEPARPLAERRALQSPLTDLAGLVRSIDYAGRMAVANGDLSERARPGWTRGTTRALTTAYFRHAAGVVPPDPGDAALLLDVYLLQKGLYEIRYELANRPDWVRYPLAAVMDMIGR